MFNGSSTSTLLMIVLFIALGYFMLVRPGRVQAKKKAELMKELAPGARVQTQIGVYGTLIEMGDVQALLEIAPGVVITVDKRLISGVTPRSRDEFHTYPDDDETSTVETSTVESPAETTPVETTAGDVPPAGTPEAPSAHSSAADQTIPPATAPESAPRTDEGPAGSAPRNA
ncbi:preprotein translocase subunit YajC [Raineyella fluvialis]|uniref:Preprotein translocase subunit YajC n=1 Tax=Raineyella fluvialis TaxID=2662261 RepID=A0A5Q2FDR3_9ACTN|nr:preprotein translocase subunit YajC [Raineyella fluvialis]QGF24511.1 preprotein translocase subunit YajC [Raineyella fluvialis]